MNAQRESSAGSVGKPALLGYEEKIEGGSEALRS